MTYLRRNSDERSYVLQNNSSHYLLNLYAVHFSATIKNSLRNSVVPLFITAFATKDRLTRTISSQRLHRAVEKKLFREDHPPPSPFLLCSIGDQRKRPRTSAEESRYASIGLFRMCNRRWHRDRRGKGTNGCSSSTRKSARWIIRLSALRLFITLRRVDGAKLSRMTRSLLIIVQFSRTSRCRRRAS